MASVKYIAPIGLDLHQYSGTASTCRVFPRAIVAPLPDRRPYLVEVETDWKEAGITEGDLFIVDDREPPFAGCICIFSDGNTLNAQRIREHKGALLPVSHHHQEGYQLSYCGTVTRLIRYCV